MNFEKPTQPDPSESGPEPLTNEELLSAENQGITNAKYMNPEEVRMSLSDPAPSKVENPSSITPEPQKVPDEIEIPTFIPTARPTLAEESLTPTPKPYVKLETNLVPGKTRLDKPEKEKGWLKKLFHKKDKEGVESKTVQPEVTESNTVSVENTLSYNDPFGKVPERFASPFAKKDSPSLEVKESNQDVAVEDNNAVIEEIVTELAPIAEVLADNPTPEEVASAEAAVTKSMEKASPAEREKIGLGLRNMGYWIEEKKNEKFSSLFAKAAEMTGKEGTLGRFFTALNTDATNRATNAQRKMQAIDEGERGTLGSAATLSGNILKYGRTAADTAAMFGVNFLGIAASPFRYVMMGAQAFSRGAAAGKEARFANEELVDKNRTKDEERVAEEAWAIYEKAIVANGGKIPDKESLDQAYKENLPQDLIDRLSRSYQGGTSTMNILGHIIGLDLKGAIRGDVKRDVEGIQAKIEKIELNDSLSPEQKKLETDKILSKVENRLRDYDRMISDAGKVDAWAMGAKYAETAGKAVVGGMMVETVALALNKIFENSGHIFATTEKLISSPDTAQIENITPADTSHTNLDVSTLPVDNKISGLEHQGFTTVVKPTDLSKGISFNEYAGINSTDVPAEESLDNATGQPNTAKLVPESSVTSPDQVATPATAETAPVTTPPAEAPDAQPKAPQASPTPVSPAEAPTTAPDAIKSPEATEQFVGTVKEGGNAWEATHDLVKSGKITAEQFEAAWSNPDSVIELNGEKVHISKLGLTHAGDKFTYVPGTNGAAGHFTVLDNPADNMSMGSDETYAKILDAKGKDLPNWLAESVGRTTESEALENMLDTTSPENMEAPHMIDSTPAENLSTIDHVESIQEQPRFNVPAEFKYDAYGHVSEMRIGETSTNPIKLAEMRSLLKNPNLTELKVPKGMTMASASKLIDSDSKHLVLLQRFIHDMNVTGNSNSQEAEFARAHANGILTRSKMIFGDIYKSNIIPKK